MVKTGVGGQVLTAHETVGAHKTENSERGTVCECEGLGHVDPVKPRLWLANDNCDAGIPEHAGPQIGTTPI